MLPPKLKTAQLRALIVGDDVARVTGAGEIETGKVTKHGITEIKVQWPAEVAWYYNESGSRKGVPLEVLRVAPSGPRCAEWIAPVAEQIDAEFERQCCTRAERDTLLSAMHSRGTAAHALLARCYETLMTPGHTAALLVGLVLYDWLRAGDAAETAPAHTSGPPESSIRSMCSAVDAARWYLLCHRNQCSVGDREYVDSLTDGLRAPIKYFSALGDAAPAVTVPDWAQAVAYG